MKSYLIDHDAEGQRTDRYLTKLFPNAGKSFLCKMLRKKNILVNGMKTEPAYFLRKGDRVDVYFSDATIEKFSQTQGTASNHHSSLPQLPDWLIHPLYEDDDLLVVNKPAGLLTQPDATGKISLADMIKNILTHEHSTFHPAPANRLDLNTSGIILVPKNYDTQKKITAAMRDRQVIKEYWALTDGVIEREQHLTQFLKKDTKTNWVQVDREGKTADLTVKPLETHGETTLALVKLNTGRSHQIRVQLASAGHPIIGDPKYGDGAVNAVFRQNYGLDHQLLHSRHYAIPALGVDFTAPLPEDFKMILKALHYREAE